MSKSDIVNYSFKENCHASASCANRHSCLLPSRCPDAARQRKQSGWGQGAWPPARVNGDPNNKNRFSSNGRWYTITYVSTANNGTPQDTTPAFVTASYALGPTNYVPSQLTIQANGVGASTSGSSASFAVDRTVSGSTTISSNANNNTGGQDRYLSFYLWLRGGLNLDRTTSVTSDAEMISSPAPFITYKITCDTSVSFGVQVQITHGAAASVITNLHPSQPKGSVQASASAATLSAFLNSTSGNLNTMGSTTVVNTGTSEFYPCTLTNGVGYFAVPLNSPLASITITSIDFINQGQAFASHHITPTQVVGPYINSGGTVPV